VFALILSGYILTAAKNYFSFKILLSSIDIGQGLMYNNNPRDKKEEMLFLVFI